MSRPCRLRRPTSASVRGGPSSACGTCLGILSRATAMWNSLGGVVRLSSRRRPGCGLSLRAAASTNVRWPGLYARLEAAADNARSLAEMARGVVSPGWWDNAACVQVLRLGGEGAPRTTAARTPPSRREARPQAGAQHILTGRVCDTWVDAAAGERLTRLGVDGLPRPGDTRWSEVRGVVSEHFAGFGALACAKTWLSAWTTTRRVHDARPLPCPFGCTDPNGDPVPDELTHCLSCEVLWAAAARAAGGEPGRTMRT